MNLLILKGFNNYFNRKIKKYSTLQDYIDNSSLHYDFENINFNPNDGVVTSQIVGSENQVEIGGSEPEPLKWEFEGTPDYIVCYDKEIIDENPVFHIRSRWFVLECVRTRVGQYQLALKRDVIADHLEQILTNPCFVEKGYVAPNNPLIFNGEGVSFNEVKKGETMLTDETGIPWIVIYMAQNFPSADLDNPYMLGNAPNKYLAVTGKTVIDTSQALSYSDLPWHDIEAGTALSNISTIRRIAGAGEINITPIIANKGNWDSKFLVGPYRANCRYHYYNNDWHLDTNTANVQSIGTNTVIDTYASHGQGGGEMVQTWGRVLKRGDLKGATGSPLTPTNDNVLWSNYGVKVPALTWEQTTESYDNYTKAAANHVLSAMNLTTANNTAAHVASIKSYLTTKKTYYESDMSHAPVPGQTNMEAYVGGPQAFLPAAEILKYNGKLVTNDNTTFYKIKVTRRNTYTRPIDYFRISGGEIVANSSNSIRQWITSNSSTTISGKTFIQNTSNTMVETWFEHAWFDIQYIPANTETIRCKIMQPESIDRIHANEVAYDMICLPYGAINFKVSQSGTIYDKTSSAPASLGIARAIAAASGSALYDMQLLPYCPYRQAAEEYGERLKEYNEYLEVIESGGTWVGPIPPKPYIDITNTANQKLLTGCWFKASTVDVSNEDPNATGWPNNTSGHTKDFVDPENKNAVTFGLWCPSVHGTFDIIHEVKTPEQDSVEYKLFNASKKFRLVSPNYTSMFEFNPLKNLGITEFNVDFTYKPYNPYIHIAPRFNADSLYGVDTNDQRGLILQGDFSVGYYSDAWANYQIQNANYANIFDRQIQNLDVAQSIERDKTWTANVTNIVSEALGLGGGLQGARAGASSGTWQGAVIGAAAGTTGGTVGAAVGSYYDWKWLNQAQKEERSYAIDMYNLNIGTIKALPYGLAKSDALTENFKYFPFIEEFESTEIEKEIFKQKLKYDGMTISAIGTLADYTPETYEIQRLKGRMIFIDNITDDFQVANAIYTEVDKGFYLVNQGD